MDLMDVDTRIVVRTHACSATCNLHSSAPPDTYAAGCLVSCQLPERLYVCVL